METAAAQRRLHRAAGRAPGAAGRAGLGAAARRPLCAGPGGAGLSGRAADPGLRPRRGRGAGGDGGRAAHARRRRRGRRGGDGRPDRRAAPAARLRAEPRPPASCCAGARSAAQARREATGSAAATRWRIASAPSEPAAGELGLGAPRWRVTLERCRGGRTGAWILEAWRKTMPRILCVWSPTWAIATGAGRNASSAELPPPCGETARRSSG